MSNHRWNIELSYHKHWFDGTIKKIRYFSHADSKKEALKILEKADNDRIKSLSWTHIIWKQY